MENRQKICDLLLLTLKATRSGGSIKRLVYDDYTESVIVTYSNGSEKRVNIACDSGVALIRDVMKAID